MKRYLLEMKRNEFEKGGREYTNGVQKLTFA
jgi:hypothetical protein